MGAKASLEQLLRVEEEIKNIHGKFPEAAKAVAESLKRNSSIGYKNYCRMFTGHSSAEELKGE